MKTKPTPTPWEYYTHLPEASGDGEIRIGQAGDTDDVPEIAIITECEAQEANAALIVKAVNCHEELLEALKAAYEMLKPFVFKLNIRSHFHEHNVLENTIKKAILKAEGKL